MRDRRAFSASAHSAARQALISPAPVSRRKWVSRSSCSTASRVGGAPACTSSVATSSGCSDGPRLLQDHGVVLGGPDRGEARLPQRSLAAGRSRVATTSRRRAQLRQSVGVQLLQQPALVDDADAGGQPVHLGEDMARHEHRHAVVPRQLRQVLADLHDTRRVEAVGRLVEDQQLRLVEQRAGQPQPLQVARGQLAGPPPGVRRQTQARRWPRSTVVPSRTP